MYVNITGTPKVFYSTASSGGLFALKLTIIIPPKLTALAELFLFTFWHLNSKNNRCNFYGNCSGFIGCAWLNLLFKCITRINTHRVLLMQFAPAAGR